jgi:predicted Rossmann-fold nucleotide-binding protein
MIIEKIISGGQTGVDRAALDVALELGLPCGGWCPKGRRAEDGPIPERYPLQENESTSYPERTAMNVRDADGTLIITRGQPDRGTGLTLTLAKRYKKPHVVIDLDKAPKTAEVRKWLRVHRIKILNVAGPRESSAKGIYQLAADLLRKVCQNRKSG